MVRTFSPPPPPTSNHICNTPDPNLSAAFSFRRLLRAFPQMRTENSPQTLPSRNHPFISRFLFQVVIMFFISVVYFRQLHRPIRAILPAALDHPIPLPPPRGPIEDRLKDFTETLARVIPPWLLVSLKQQCSHTWWICSTLRRKMVSTCFP